MDISALIVSITDLHRDTIPQWIANGMSSTQQGLLKLVEENHAFNFQLWHAEDRARREDMGHSFVYHAKREIDLCNQQRNDRMEAIDTWIAEALPLPSADSCPVHSETPGMMIDRLSILSLKSYYMHQQSNRGSADETHRQRCTQKATVLLAQHKQLTLCLQQLLTDIQDEVRTFRRYQQFKMYNDPALNPELHSQ